MKKLLLLISLCLLSQNYSIVSASAGENISHTPPVPVSSTQNISETADTDLQSDIGTGNSAAPIPANNITSRNEESSVDSDTVLSFPQETVEANIPQVITDTVSETSTVSTKPPVPFFVQQQEEESESSEEEQVIEPVFQEVRATITRVEFPESQVFTPEELQKLAEPLFEKPVSIEDIKKVVDGITRCYILGDYTTSRAYLPPQTIENGVLKIGLMEGTVGNVRIEDNRWTRTTYITKRVPVEEGSIVRLGKLQENIIKFNNQNTAKLKVELYAGENQGETDIVLKTEEPFPLKIGVMTDNAGRESTGKNRVGGMITYDSLLGYRDKLSLGGYLGRGTRIGFADYNFPLNKYGTRFGVSASANNIDIIKGPMRQFGMGGKSQVYTAYLTHPLINSSDFSLNTYTSANLKHSSTDISGIKILANDTFSVTQGLTARKDTERGIWYTGQFGSVGFKALSGKEEFFKYEGNVTRLHDFGKGIIGEFRLAGQFSPDKNLPWMEQFQLGGISTVRGYSEALLLGRSGYFASGEILTPLPFLPRKIGSDRLGYLRPRDMIKGAVFMDHGMVFPYKYGDSIDSGDFLMSWGVGLRMHFNQNLGARFYWGFGLNNKYEADHKAGRFHFEVTCAPDLGTVLSQRKPKAKSKKREKQGSSL